MSFEKFKEYHNANYHDGDSTFDERNYKKSNGDDFDNWFVQDCYDHFEAGAQSRQAEIDELQRKLNLCEALRNNQFELLIKITEQRDTSQKYVIELQKRIDEALKYVSESPLKDVSRKAMLNFLDILKGNKND